MEIVKSIRILDGSQHETKDRALNRLVDILSSRENLKFIEGFTGKNALEARNYLIDNVGALSKILQIIYEMGEVKKLKNF